MRGAFYGIGAAVIAIIGRSVWKLGKMTLAKDRLLWALFAVSAFVTAWADWAMHLAQSPARQSELQREARHDVVDGVDHLCPLG